jgi:hypothetical protein
MNIKKLINEKELQLDSQNYIEFTIDELNKLQTDEVQYLIDHFHGYTMVKLPQPEISFFEWLKRVDRLIWDDLWEEEDADLYLVSIDLLLHLTSFRNGFPICDLTKQPNFWFTVNHIKPKGMKEIERIFKKVEQREKLNIQELFLFELSKTAIDIWHFCHRYNIPVDVVKKAVEETVFNGWLVHLPEREDLIKYIDV